MITVSFIILEGDLYSIKIEKGQKLISNKDTTGSGVIWYSKLALQYLSIPKTCCKANYYLKKYEKKKGLPTD